MKISEEMKNEIFSLLEYNPDSGKFYWLHDGPVPSDIKAGDLAGRNLIRGYPAVKILRQTCYMHRLAFVFMTGDWPRNTVDHINRIPTDNRWCNLRDTDQTQNQYNTKRKSSNASGRNGVSLYKVTGEWEAYIYYKYKKVRLGFFNTFGEAVAAREKAERYYFECK